MRRNDLLVKEGFGEVSEIFIKKRIDILIMADRYFVRYESPREEEPYALPKDLKQRLKTIPDLRILLDSEVMPVLIVEASPEAIAKVESLEGIVHVFGDVSVQPFEPKK